jgi:hypothetical protein
MLYVGIIAFGTVISALRQCILLFSSISQLLEPRLQIELELEGCLRG